MRKLALLLAMLMTFCTLAFSQTQTVKGKVTGSDGNPLPNISVLVKGKTSGTTTNAKGEYEISVPANASLVFSGVGFEEQTLKVGNSSQLNVLLKSSAVNLSEVIVTTSLGIKRSEKSVGYAISKVDPGALVQQSEPDVLKNLQGKVPGVDIRVGQGMPGASTRIQIRGISSIGLETQPLIVVDGVPYSNDEVSAGVAGGQAASGTSFNDLDANDIQSLTILKGAAAAGLYGSRASNGVILITTKSGAAQKGPKPINVNFKSSFSLEKIGFIPEFQNSYGAGANFKMLGANGSWGAKFGQGVIYNSSGNVIGTSASGVDSMPASIWSAYYAAYPELFPNGRVAYEAHPNNVKDLFQTGNMYENSVNFNGGNNTTSFNATLSNISQTGFMLNSSFVKNNASVGGQTSFGKLTLGGNVSYAHSKQVSGYFGTVQSFLTEMGRTFTQARNWNIPGYPSTDKNGNQIGFNTGQYTNPIWASAHNTATSYDDRTVATVRATYKATNFLSFNYTFGVNSYTLSRDAIVDQSSYGSSDNAVGNLTETSYRTQSLTSTFMAVITPKISRNFSLDIKVGNDFNQNSSRYQQVYGAGFIVRGLYNLRNTNTKTFNADTRHYRRLVGFFGDATLGYKNFAFLNISGREDMTSTLPYKNAKYFYPGISGSFIWTDAFKLRSNWLNYGKIRLGYAKVGNDADPQNGQDIFDLYNTAFLGQPRAARSGTTYDPNLTPEFTHELEAGFDFQLFKGRITSEITWYDKKTTNLIYSVDVPSTTGYNSYYTNIGEIENKGWEIGLSVKPIVFKDFTWEAKAAYTHNEGKVNRLVDGLQRISYGAGQYLEAGFAFPFFRGSVAARYDGKLLVDPNTGWAVEDPTDAYIGDSNPKYKLGITNSFTYKGLTLSALFDMTVGGLFYSDQIGSMLGRGVTLDTKDRETNRVIDGYYANMTPVPDANGDLRFQPLLVNGKPVQNQTRITTNDLFFQGGVTYNTSFATNSSLEFNVFPSTVYHLREISIGYNIPQKVVSRLKLSNINISLSGRNLWTLAPDVPKYTHYDPEVNSTGTSPVQGFDNSGVPPPKRYGININVTF